MPPATACAINSATAGGGRVVAVGTTAARAVEVTGTGPIAVPSSGWTERVISVAEPPRIVDGHIPGWHDPLASNLLLVEAVVGAELTRV